MNRLGMRPGAWICGAALAVGGCTGEVEMWHEASLMSGDSAGVEVVTFDAGRLPPVGSVDPVPEWVLGEGKGLEPLVSLHRVVDVTTLSEQRVAVANGSTQQILVVDRSQGTIERLGGEGDGPSEFRGLARLFRCHEGALCAHDSRRGRLLTFHVDRGSVEERELPRVGAPGNVPRLDMDGEGALYLSVIPALPEGPGVERPWGEVVVLEDEVVQLTALRGREVFRNATGTGLVILGSTTVTAADAGQGIWIGDTAKPEVLFWRRSVGPVRAVRWTSEEMREVTDSDRASFWSALDAAVPPGAGRPSGVLRDAVPFAERWPAFGRLVVAEEGDLWIGQPVEPAAELTESGPPLSEVWTVVHFREGIVRRVRTPEGFRLMEVRRDRLLGVHMDELGVETVRQYRFQGPLTHGGGS